MKEHLQVCTRVAQRIELVSRGRVLGGPKQLKFSERGSKEQLLDIHRPLPFIFLAKLSEKIFKCFFNRCRGYNEMRWDESELNKKLNNTSPLLFELWNCMMDDALIIVSIEATSWEWEMSMGLSERWRRASETGSHRQEICELVTRYHASWVDRAILLTRWEETQKKESKSYDLDSDSAVAFSRDQERGSRQSAHRESAMWKAMQSEKEREGYGAEWCEGKLKWKRSYQGVLVLERNESIRCMAVFSRLLDWLAYKYFFPAS